MKINLADVNPQRILILHTAFLGDIILTLPLLQAAKSLFPQASIDFLAIPAVKNILETHPGIEKLWIYDKHKKERGILNSLKLMRRLKQRKFDLALVPHRSIRSALLVWGAKIPVRIGFDRSAGKFLFTTVIPFPRKIHEINRNLHLLKPFGWDVKRKVFPKLYFGKEDQAFVAGWLQEEGIRNPKNLIAIAPGSVWATKRWLPEYFARLSDLFIEKGFQIVLIGGDADKAVAQQVQERSVSRLVNAVGKFSLRQSAYLIQNSRLLITNDSAPLHMATVAQTPVLAIFGPTVKAFGFFPYGENSKIVENNTLTCRPCGSHGGHKCPIGTFDCMKTVLPETVFREALELIDI